MAAMDEARMPAEMATVLLAVQREVFTPDGGGGLIRDLVVRILFCMRYLVRLRPLFEDFARLSEVVRRMWSHYGALRPNATVFSGRDPSNVVYNFAWALLLMEWPARSDLQGFTSLKTAGNMIEGLLGYCWWRIHRSELDHSAVEVCVRQELTPWMQISAADIAVFQQSWAWGWRLDGWCAWLEDFVQACEALMQHLPIRFPGTKAGWRDAGGAAGSWSRFEELRLMRRLTVITLYPGEWQQIWS